MTRIDALRCDRCKRISSSEQEQGRFLELTVEDKKLDLCPSCRGKLTSFLDGDELEVPP